MSTADRVAWLFLCLFVFTIPWEKGLWVGSIGTIAKAAGIAAFFAGLLAAGLRRTSREFPWRPPGFVLLAAVVFVGWSALTVLWSADRPATITRALTLSQLLAMLWLLWEFCRGPRRLRTLMTVYLAGACTGAAITFVRYALDMQTYYRRYAATGFDPNTFGLILALAIPVALSLGFTAKGATRWCFYAAAMMLMAAVLLTASRTALIATFVGFAFPLWRWPALRWADRGAAAALFVLLLLSLAEFAPSPARERLATIPSEITSGTFNSRKQIWKSGARAFLEHPILGVGAGAYPEAVSPWLGRPSQPGMMYVAHNTFLSVLVECGVLGFTLYGILLSALLLGIWMMPPPERALWAVLFFAWAVGVSTLTWEHHKVTWLLFGWISVQSARSWWPGGGSQ